MCDEARMAQILELGVAVIIDEVFARSLLQQIEALPNFAPRRYDLNQRGQPRAWQLDHAVIDLLTQRTQLFTIEGATGTVHIATGKHGAPATLAAIGEVEAVVEQLRL